MEILEYFDLKENDIVSIVGAGGKTTLMFRLANEIKKDQGRVLVTTTTKIYVPEKGIVDYICIGESHFHSIGGKNEAGIYVCGLEINSENKIIGLEEHHFAGLIGDYDYILIEADGAKKKCLKGWNAHEPVICSGTTKTIGVVDIQSLGMTVCEDNIHRSEAFCNISGARQGEAILPLHLLNMIVHPQGLFKNARGEKILFINKADDAGYLNKGRRLAEALWKHNSEFLGKIIIGSLHSDGAMEKG